MFLLCVIHQHENMISRLQRVREQNLHLHPPNVGRGIAAARRVCELMCY